MKNNVEKVLTFRKRLLIFVSSKRAKHTTRGYDDESVF